MLVLRPPSARPRETPWPQKNCLLSRLSYSIDTVFGQLVERYHTEEVWARDTWPLYSRLLRKVLSRTVAVLLNVANGNPLSQLGRLVT